MVRIVYSEYVKIHQQINSVISAPSDIIDKSRAEVRETESRARSLVRREVTLNTVHNRKLPKRHLEKHDLMPTDFIFRQLTVVGGV